MQIDLVNRFAPTPMQTTVHWSGKIISFSTNSSVLLKRIADAAAEPVEARAAKVDCSWRVVTEPEDDEGLEFDALMNRHIRDAGVSFVTIGRRSFLAYDHGAGRGISFLSERIVQDRTLFVGAFLPGFAALVWGGKQQW